MLRAEIPAADAQRRQRRARTRPCAALPQTGPAKAARRCVAAALPRQSPRRIEPPRRSIPLAGRSGCPRRSPAYRIARRRRSNPSPRSGAARSRRAKSQRCISFARNAPSISITRRGSTKRTPTATTFSMSRLSSIWHPQSRPAAPRAKTSSTATSFSSGRPRTTARTFFISLSGASCRN